MNKSLNNILAKLYCDGVLLLDTNVDHLHEYLFAIKNSDSITVKDRNYSLKHINMIHNTSTGKMVIELQIHLKEIR